MLGGQEGILRATDYSIEYVANLELKSLVEAVGVGFCVGIVGNTKFCSQRADLRRVTINVLKTTASRSNVSLQLWTKSSTGQWSARKVRERTQVKLVVTSGKHKVLVKEAVDLIQVHVTEVTMRNNMTTDTLKGRKTAQARNMLVEATIMDERNPAITTGILE
jgi:hypothetical protein